MLILSPRMSSISFLEASRRLWPWKMTSPLVILPGVSFKSCMMEREVTLFPQPDSPTRPTISPFFISKLTSSTAVTLLFLLEKNSVRRCLTSSKFSWDISLLLSSFDLRIKGITESVAEKVEGKNCDKDYQTREIHHMRRHVQVASALGEHCSPLGVGHVCSEAQEA